MLKKINNSAFNMCNMNYNVNQLKLGSEQKVKVFRNPSYLGPTANVREVNKVINLPNNPKRGNNCSD